jgi:hypothetical protein
LTALIHPDRPVVAARVNHGRWIVQCWVCESARSLRSLRFGTPRFDCWDCGLEAEVLWPSEEMRQGIQRLLMMRPYPKHRSWEPGETLNDLMRENADNGLFDHLPVEAEPTSLLTVTDDRILVDRLPIGGADGLELALCGGR